jgi:antitoxin component YwqK of YwqJK toxin-antitoxin module
VWYLFFDDEVNLLQVKNYSNGVLNGECVTYFKKGESKTFNTLPNGHSHGDVFMKGNYVDNEKSGVWRKWYQHIPFSRKRRLREYEVYKKGKHHGPYWYWHRNGELGKEGNFEGGNRVGLWSFWDEKGVRTQKMYQPAKGEGETL